MQKRLAILVAVLLGDARRGLGVLGGPLGHRAASRTATCALQNKSRRVSAAALHCSKVRALTHFYAGVPGPSDRAYSTTDFAGCRYPRNTPGLRSVFFARVWCTTHRKLQHTPAYNWGVLALVGE